MNVAPLRATVAAFGADKGSRLAAAIAYSTIFSLVPLLIVVIAIGGPLLGSHTRVEDSIMSAIGKSAGPSAAAALRQVVANAYNKPRQGLIAQVVGWIMFAVGASGLFMALQDALNAVWHVETTKGGWKEMVRSRGVSFGMILVVLFLLLVTFVANSAIAVVGARFRSMLPFAVNPTAVTVVDQVVMLAVVAVVFALIFKVLPDVTLEWRDVWVGAAVTSVLFVIGENLIAVYMAVGGVSSAYGAAGSLLAALIWIYYSAMLLLLGAEFTKVTARSAALTLPSGVSAISDQPPGVDPRSVREPRNHPNPASGASASGSQS